MKPDVASMHFNHDTYLNFYNAEGQAQGGRIGYRTWEFVDEDIETLGGFLINKFEKVPTKQEIIEINNFIFTVLSADSKKINRIQLIIKKDNNSSWSYFPYYFLRHYMFYHILRLTIRFWILFLWLFSLKWLRMFHSKIK